MKTYAFRLHRGDDLRECLESFARAEHIQASVIVSCVGCVSRARLRDASGVRVRDIPEHCEIVSATGTLSEHRTHIHLSLSREDLSTLGGHLTYGCIINTTAEIVLLVPDGLRFCAEPDPETGYDELKIEPC